VNGAPFFLIFAKPNSTEMIRRISMLLVIVLISGLTVSAQKRKVSGFMVTFYNTENFFDTIDNPAKADNDFLPTSKVPWTSDRYFHKLHNIARVLTAIDSADLPAVMGFAEIENIRVLQDLVTLTPLNRANYQAILEDGSDPRGINVALAFRRDVMKEITHKAFPAAITFNTRCILYVKLTDSKKNIYHFFVNHWKSREGTSNETDAKRAENAKIMKHLADSIRSMDALANIIIMGDFNDEPKDKSISEYLGALQPIETPDPAHLYDLLYEPFLKGEGTLYYKDWDVFDQFIVSGNLLSKKHGKLPFVEAPYAFIFKRDWMLYTNKKGDRVPNRTASSKEYFGGFSDHLPVYMVVKY